jgi:hypothetical protein
VLQHHVLEVAGQRVEAERKSRALRCLAITRCRPVLFSLLVLPDMGV